MKPKNTFRLKPGDKLQRDPNKPIISVKYGYVWIGNNAVNDKACFGTISGRKTLLRLSAAIYRAAHYH